MKNVSNPDKWALVNVGPELLQFLTDRGHFDAHAELGSILSDMAHELMRDEREAERHGLG